MDKLALVLALAVVAIGAAARLHAWVSAQRGPARTADAPVAAGTRGLLARHLRTSVIWSAALAAVVFVGHRFASPASYDGSASSPSVLASSGAMVLVLGAVMALFATRVSAFAASADAPETGAPGTAAGQHVVAALRGGAVGALAVVGLALIGLVSAFAFTRFFAGGASVTTIPLRMAPYALGAVVVALVSRTAGAIFGRAADVGELALREVDPTIASIAGGFQGDLRNPALVMALVGRRLGDRLGRAAEVFAQVAVEGVAVMIVAGGFADANHAALARLGIDPWSLVLFPLVVRAFALVATVAGVMAVKTEVGEPPMDALDRGYWVTLALSSLALIATTYWTFRGAFLWFSIASLLGVLGGHAFVVLARYHGDARYRPARAMAEGSTEGGSVVVHALAIGLGGTAIPALVLSLVVAGAYRSGEASGLSHGGVLATAVAASGMLAAATYLFAIEHLDASSAVSRSDLDLENSGFVDGPAFAARTLTRGHTLGVVMLLALSAMRAYLYVILVQRAPSTGMHAPLDLDLGRGVMLLCALGGAALAATFVALCLEAVGHVSATVVAEARAELAEVPREEGRIVFPIDHLSDDRRCVESVSADAHLHALSPLLLAVAVPIVVGFFARRAGGVGAEAALVLVVVAALVGFLLASVLGTTGVLVLRATHSAHGEQAVGALHDVALPTLTVFVLAVVTVVLVLAPLFA